MRRARPCFTLTAGAPPTDPQQCAPWWSPDGVVVRAFCAPRAVAVAGIVAVPGAGRAYLAVVPPGAGLREVRVAGRVTRRMRAPASVPPARRHCGYATGLYDEDVHAPRPRVTAQTSASHT